MNDLLYHKKIFNHNPLNNKEYYFLRCIDKFNKLLQNKESYSFYNNDNEIQESIEFNKILVIIK